LPRAVILKRFATDLRVLLRAMRFGIRGESLISAGAMTNALFNGLCARRRNSVAGAVNQTP
jgi:hypothetical protein